VSFSAQRTLDILRTGLRAIARNGLRSALTALGIIIGVGCVLTMVAVASGASSAVTARIESLGTNFLMIFPGAVTQSGARIFTGQSNLTAEDADAIARECPSVAWVSPGVRSAGQIVARDANWSTSIQGVGPDWPQVRAWNVAEGGFFGDAEVRSAAKVAVLGRTVADNLFPDGDAVGQVVRIRNVPFRVLGVLDGKGGATSGQDQDDLVVAPYTTVMKRLSGVNRLQIIYVSARAPDQVASAESEIEALLRQRHRLAGADDSDFMIRSQEEMASTAAESSRILAVLLGSVASISLLVGGIGIMNIMLVSVTERTREIGLRMAVGAKGRHVLAQFLAEAIVLSAAGGLVGVVLGVAGSEAIARFAGWPVELRPQAVLLAFGFAVAVGVFFGFYPARRAAGLDPIEALRYE
jgi:putative ABC transport system permease protein